MYALKALSTLTFLAFTFSNALAQSAAPALSGDQIVDKASPAVVLILAGPGDGRVAAIGSGLIVRSDGVVLTANHVVKGMRELQVRLKNGDIYAQVDRRDLARRCRSLGMGPIFTANTGAHGIPQ